MRLFLDLSVGRKLAAAAGLAILMLGGLMAFNRMQMDRVMAEQAASVRTDAAFERLRAGAGHVRAVAPVERDMLLAQGGPAIGAARDRALAELEAASPLLAGSGGTLGEQLGAYRAAVEALAEQRLRLVGLRDQDLARATEDYDAVQEAVQSGIGFDLTGAAQEEAREKLGAVQAAANDVRIGIQRLLATGEEAQARRVRRGAAQIRVHARGLLAVEAPDSLRSDVRRLSEAGERLGAAALEVIAAGDAVAKLRAERLAPAEAALAASVATLSAGLQAEAARQRAEVVEAVAEVNAANIWAGLGVVLVLVLSGVANARAIGTPMRRLSAAIARIAAGKAGEPVPDRGRRDEIGRIADALESLRGTVGRAFAQGQMIEQLPLAVMGCDPGADFQVTYMNATSRELLGRLRAHLPCEPEALLGQSIDVLHRDPRHIRALLSAPERLPHTARIRLGAEVMELRVSAIRDAGGAYSGAMLTWSLATEKARLADTFETEVGAVVEAVAASAAQLQAASRGLSEAAATSNAEAGAVAEAGGRAHREVQAVAAAAEEMAASVSEISRR
ncbi:MAG TPA: HAMP domain-containing protein, partial [Acetobacteraceae bacterium]|nr:HAMP domain-containing protein [Acetobacteraceae bacterium]